jgi:hypothetical protein
MSSEKFPLKHEFPNFSRAFCNLYNKVQHFHCKKYLKLHVIYWFSFFFLFQVPIDPIVSERSKVETTKRRRSYTQNKRRRRLANDKLCIFLRIFSTLNWLEFFFLIDWTFEMSLKFYGKLSHTINIGKCYMNTLYSHTPCTWDILVNSQPHILFHPGCHMSEFCVGVRGVLPHGGVHVSPLINIRVN